MFPGMMDPEMMKLAQQQMSRMSPVELSKIQQQMMSNPELMKMASDSMKHMKPEDLRQAAEQLKASQPNEMTEIGEKMENATQEELSAMHSQVDAQINYQVNATHMLKQQGNELHRQGRFNDALEKYLRAKNHLKGIPSSKGATLLLACSLNLMSCYLKTSQYDECIKEGIEVMATDPRNVKALYRRGQAFKSLGQLENAVLDLTKALEFSPDDETIADVLRDAKEKFAEHGAKDAQSGLRIEEISNEVPTPLSAMNETSSSKLSGQKTKATGEYMTSVLPTNTEYLQALRDDKESIRLFQNFVSQADSESLASMGGGEIDGISPDMVKTASTVISNMPPEEFQRMFEMATSFHPEHLSDANSNHGTDLPPDMLKTTGDKMPAEELQKMFRMASPLSGNLEEMQGNGTLEEVLNSTSAPQPSFPCSRFEMHEQVRNQMKNPAMRESSMMKNMSPDMMANMSEHLGCKLSPEDAEKAQQTISSLSPETIDRMMKWTDRIQRAVEGARSTKKWLLGRKGLAMALLVLLLAIFLHWLGYINH